MFKLPDPSGFKPESRIWSPYQEAVFDAMDSNRNLLINAVAGSGKTTTIIEAMHRARGRCGFFAFNKAIAEDIKSRVSGQLVQTLNALGHSLWRQNEPSAKLETMKVSEILRKLMRPTDFKEYGWQLRSVVSLMKANAFGITQDILDQDVADLIESYQMDFPAEIIEDLAQIAIKAFMQSIEDRKTFDFDDQLYAPVAFDWTFPKLDCAFIDEAQDLNPLQHLMMEMLVQRGSRLVAVGDPHQGIYGFRGAMTDSISKLQSQFNMLELPLSISYRCPKAVVSEAQQLVPHIQASPSAIQGQVSWADSDPETFVDGWMIICRNNAPLMAVALRHLREKRPCQIRTNALDTLEGFIRRFQESDCRKLLVKIEAWKEEETKKALDKFFFGRVAAIEDRFDTLKLFCQEFRLVSEMLHAIKSIAQSTTGPILSTGHKAKGLEADNVYILRPDLCPSKFAQSPEQMQQEHNLLYVMITRAKQSLIYGATDASSNSSYG